MMNNSSLTKHAAHNHDIFCTSTHSFDASPSNTVFRQKNRSTGFESLVARFNRPCSKQKNLTESDIKRNEKKKILRLTGS